MGDSVNARRLVERPGTALTTGNRPVRAEGAGTLPAATPMPPLDALMAAGEETCGTSFSLAVLATVPGTPPSLDELRLRVEQRWSWIPRLRLRWQQPTVRATSARYLWAETPHFDPVAHVSVLPPRPGATIATVAGELVSARMPDVPSGPLWQLHLVPRAAPGQFALLLRAHHALLDMASLATMMRLLCDGPGALTPSETAPSVPGPSPATVPYDHPRGARRLTSAAHALLGMARPAARPRTVLRADSARAVAWSSVPHDVVDAARRALPDLPVTVNDVVLAAFTGALRAVPGVFGAPRALDRVYCAVPVNLRSAQNAHVLGNGASAVRVLLPLSRTDPLARLHAVHRAMADNKARRRAEGGATLSAAAARLPSPALAAFGRLYFATRQLLTVTCSNARLCDKPLTLGASPVASLIGITPLLPGSGIQAQFTTYDGTHTFCPTGEPAHRDLLQPAADAFAAEVHALAALADRGRH